MKKTERTRKVSLSTDHLSLTVSALALMVVMSDGAVSDEGREALEALCGQIDVDSYDVLSTIRGNAAKGMHR